MGKTKYQMFVRTCTDNGIENHLTGQADVALCGLDTSGDEEIHCLEPEYNDDCRVTCADCKRIIETVKIYLKRRKKTERGE
jgi:hypothetical protein